MNPDETTTTLRLALYDEKTKVSLARGRARFLRKNYTELMEKHGIESLH